MHALSSYLVREASTGDGILFPEDLLGMADPPPVVELFPWESGGGVRDFALAATYLGLLRKRFSQLFRRGEWRIVLSPHLLDCQSQVWGALLREASIRRFQLTSNLECLCWSRVEDAPGLFLHWGAGGATWVPACREKPTVIFVCWLGSNIWCGNCGVGWKPVWGSLWRPPRLIACCDWSASRG
jgi:hypothetical protein